MNNEELVCQRIREILWIPAHISNEAVLDITKNTFLRSRVEFDIVWNKFILELKIALKKVINRSRLH